MKLFFLSAISALALGATAQTKPLDRAIIYTTTNVIAPEDEDVSQIGGNQGGPGGGMRMNFMDGETKSTTFVQGALVKTSYRSEMGKGAVYRDNEKKTTATIIEVMGNKMGFGGSDDEQAEAGRRNDSMMKARIESGDTTMRRRMPRSESFPVTVVNTEETKKIAGYNAKKAWLVTDKILAKDSLAVWYTPDVKFANLNATGGLAGFGPMGGAAPNFSKVDGFVLAYDQKMPRGRLMEVRVTKIETDKEITPKEFEVPKDVEIRKMSDMGGGQGGFRMMRQ